jgi:type II secretory pathway component GspD/PulD (secretin)
VVEYTSTDDNGAGFFAALKALGSKLSVAVGDKSAFANLVSFKDATIEAVLSVISQDSRFAVLDSSSLRVVSGKSGRLVVGQEVPVLSQFQLDAKGNPVQSVQYRSSGVILDVKPLVVSDKVHAELLQEVSSFAVTRTSNIDSPTLLKRQFSTNLTADFGEVVFLGGLDEDRNTEAQSGLFGWRLSRNESKSKTTLFLVLQFAKA